MSFWLPTHKHTPDGDRLKSSLPETPIPPSRRDPSDGRVRSRSPGHATNMAESGRRLGHKKPGKHPFSNGRTAAARGWRCLTRHPGAIESY